MDLLDLRIFRSLGILPYGGEATDLSRLKPWVIAKKLGVDGSTVKTRLRRMEKNGFIQYFQVYPNFRLLGIHGVAYVFELGDVVTKPEVLERCALVDGVTEIHNFLGTLLCIDFTYQEERDARRRLELLSQLTGCAHPRRFYERVMPPVDLRLSRTDWRIIRALRYQALRPLAEVAKELGLTVKTVRRRFERMARHHGLIVVPVVNPAHLAHTITYMLLLRPAPDRWEQVVHGFLSDFDRSYFLTRLTPPSSAAFYLTAQTLAETEDTLVRARRTEGVQDAQLLILREVRENSQWLDSAIERKIAESSTSVAPRLAPPPASSPVGG